MADIAFPAHERSSGWRESLESLVARGEHYLMRYRARSLLKLETIPPLVEEPGVSQIEFKKGEFFLDFNGWRITDACESAEVFSCGVAWGDGASSIITASMTRYDAEGIASKPLTYDSQLEDVSPESNTLSAGDVSELLNYGRRMAVAPAIRIEDILE